MQPVVVNYKLEWPVAKTTKHSRLVLHLATIKTFCKWLDFNN